MEENIKNNGEAKEKLTFKDTVKKLSKRWFIDAFSGMAQGLFVTLIAGTIFKQIGTLIGADTGVGSVIILLGNIASMLMGAGIGVGIAKYLKAPNLVLFGCAVAGIVGAYLPDIAYRAMVSGTFTLSGMTDAVLAIKFGVPGNPIGAYVATLFALELTMLIYGKTKLDIIVVPLSILIISFANIFLAIPAIWLVAVIGKFIEISTAIVPFIMGIVIAVTMGILLTMPTSSAAIWISLAAGSTSDVMLLAGGAAVVGCACQMVGFAVMSFRENRWGGLISQGLGTSMLQIPNIMKNPKIFLPPIIASAICGPMATTLFQLRCNASGGGMGTSGLVGVFGVIDASSGVIPSWQMWLGIALLMFILPALISWGTSLLLRKRGWIKENDLKLEL
ncbi:MAG TPA: PTS sugar transporter subunit IIC [Eubacteriales bacterium]|nr:PTS sugar transporter subunit IIC [Eubacteriales bacterium]